MLLDQLRKLDEIFASLLRGDRSPRAVESCAGSMDGDVYILFRGFVDGTNDLFIRRVYGIKGLSVLAFDEFIVDEPIWMSKDQYGFLCYFFNLLQK